MQIIPVTEGRKRLGELIDIVKYQHSVIVLGKHGEAEALLIAIPGEGKDFSITQINAHSPSFAFLDAEPNLYSRDDLKKHYV
jgi:prevent-host-death family protein